MTEANSPSFRLRTLGSTGLESIDGSGAARIVLGPGKPFALLVYLALAPRRTADRDSLVDLLWATAEPDRARQTLRQTLSNLRHLLGDETLSSGAHEVTLHANVAVDRDAFLAAMHAGRHTDAARLYTGPFLSGFAIAGGESFDRWAALERDRLHGAHLFALDSVARSHLGTGHPREAEPAARSLRDADPFNQAAWRMLIESLLSAGNALEAKLEADALERFLAAEGADAEPATRDAVRRARHLDPVKPSGPSAPTLDLIGRESEFALLLEAWARAAAGHSQVVEIVAPAGLGKTRLLQDLLHRLRARSSHTVLVRAVWGERSLPFALAAAVAVALAPMRGAAGISPGAARTLVGLDPALASYFNSPPSPPEGSPEGIRQVSSALLELFRAVSDERPLAMLIDDLHWADQLSLAALGAVVSRLDGEKIMIAVANRPPRSESFAGSSPLHVELLPLTRDQVRALVLSIAAPGVVPWDGGLLDALASSTGGSPLLVLETLRSVRDSGLLTTDGDSWRSGEPTLLLAEIQRGSALVHRLQQQSSEGRRILLLCAAAGSALTEGALLAAYNGSFDEVRGALDELERRGLVTRQQWRIAITHDQLAEAVIAAATAEGLRAARRAIGRALASSHDPTLTMMQQAARHLVEGGSEEDLGDLYLTWRKKARELGDQRSDRRLAAALLADLADSRRIRAMLASRPLLQRWSGDVQLWAAAIAGTLVLGAVALVIALTPRATKLAFSVAPLSGSDALGFVPVPIVEIRDQYGRTLRAAHDTVHIGATTPGVSLRGETLAVARDGYASFRNVFLINPESRPVGLRFSAAHLPPLELTLSTQGQQPARLLLVEARLNGQLLSPSRRTLSVAPGDSIVGSVLFAYTTIWPAASVMLAAVPGWGDRRSSYVNLGPLVTPGADLARAAPIHLRAPLQAGCYRLIFAFQAEDDVKYVVSGTNWQVGKPIWNDGNDIVEWGAQEWRAADSAGYVMSTIVRITNGKLATAANRVPATTLRIDVQDPRRRAGLVCSEP